MSVSLAGERPAAEVALSEVPGQTGRPPSGLRPDSWPHTARPMPWLVAGFLVMVFLVPFPSIILKIHLPANPTLDRVFLVVMVAVFITGRAALPTKGARRRLTPVEIAVLAFGAVALLSIVLNIDRIYQENQIGFVAKGFSQLIAYGVFFFLVIATIRPDEMPAFSRLILILTTIAAVGTIYESRTGYNAFYLWSASLLHPFADVAASPTTLTPVRNIVGPTQHGLALASMLTIGLPFAILPLLEDRPTRQKLRYLAVVGLVLGADLATDRLTAIFAPLAAIIVLCAFERRILKALPIAVIVLIPIIHFASPGALGGITQVLPLSGGNNYTDGRSGDYAAVAPDILNNLIIGRGYSTLNVLDSRIYRNLDNEYLDTLFEVGVIGLAAYLAIVVSALATARKVIKRRGLRAPAALAAAAGCAAFGVVSATYDAAGYPQALYSFLFVAALIVVASKRTDVRPAWRA